MARRPAVRARGGWGGGLGLALLVWAAPLPAQQAPAPAPTPALGDQLNAWFRKAVRSARGEWGVAVADELGQLLWSVNATAPLIPASTVKLFTTGFARTVLGSEARQVTRVVGTGYVDLLSGTWIGTWALEVNGDPTLERPGRSGPMLRDLAAQLAEQGVRRLTGPLSVQSPSGMAESSYPTVWSARHRGRSFAPLIGAVTLNENLVSFTITPGKSLGAPPEIVAAEPEGVSSLVTIRARTVNGRRDRLRIVAAGGGRYVVDGSIGLRARHRRFSATARDPHAVLEAAWGAALAQAGIEWARGPSLAQGAGAMGQLSLAEIVSAPFDSIASEVNTRSLNIGAEALLHWAGGPGDSAAARLTAHVREVTGESAVRFVDGSGLSTEDRATAYAFVKYLARFPTTPAGRNFPLLLPANGSGTLKHLGTSALSPGVVRAKTGTLGNVSSLVGYLGHKNGMLLVSVLYNGPRVYAAKQQQWQLFRVLGAEGTAVPGDAANLGALGGGGGGEEPTIPPA